MSTATENCRKALVGSTVLAPLYNDWMEVAGPVRGSDWSLAATGFAAYATGWIATLGTSEGFACYQHSSARDRLFSYGLKDPADLMSGSLIFIASKLVPEAVQDLEYAIGDFSVGNTTSMWRRLVERWNLKARSAIAAEGGMTTIDDIFPMPNPRKTIVDKAVGNMGSIIPSLRDRNVEYQRKKREAQLKRDREERMEGELRELQRIADQQIERLALTSQPHFGEWA